MEANRLEEESKTGSESERWKWFCWTCEQVGEFLRRKASFWTTPSFSTCFVASLFIISQLLSSCHLILPALCLFYSFGSLPYESIRIDREAWSITTNDGQVRMFIQSFFFGERLNNRYGTNGMRKLFSRVRVLISAVHQHHCIRMSHKQRKDSKFAWRRSRQKTPKLSNFLTVEFLFFYWKASKSRKGNTHVNRNCKQKWSLNRVPAVKVSKHVICLPVLLSPNTAFPKLPMTHGYICCSFGH